VACTLWSATGSEAAMAIDYAVGLIVTAGLLVYLTYALLKPEKF
jgi:K+-transporting ATPase KdpF subunit